MVTLRQKVFFASRPLGRGEETARRESPEGAPNAAAINRAGAGGVVGARATSATTGVLAWSAGAGAGAGAGKAGAASLLHRAAALFDLVRR